jgi:hypothetical protein
VGLAGDFFTAPEDLLATFRGASGIGGLVGPLNLKGAGGATRDLVSNDLGRRELGPHPALAADNQTLRATREGRPRSGTQRFGSKVTVISGVS